jgi:hypothetical protein
MGEEIGLSSMACLVERAAARIATVVRVLS